MWHCIAVPQRLQDLLFIHRGSMKKPLPRASGGEFAVAVARLLVKSKARANRCLVILPIGQPSCTVINSIQFTCLDRSTKELMPGKKCQTCCPTTPAAGNTATTSTTDPVLRDKADKACISAPFHRRSPERTDRISPTEKHEETRETHLRKTEETGVVLVVPVYSSPTHITRISRMIKVWLWTASGRCHKCGKDGEANRGTTVEYRSIS